MDYNKFDSIDLELLKEITDVDEIGAGAFNVRKNGNLLFKSDTEDVVINKKEDVEGIDIIVKENAVVDNLHIPVIVTEDNLKDKVYNDFYINERAQVIIKAGCGIHTHGCNQSEHSGVHRFYVSKNAKVKYIEKHIGMGDDSEKVLNPVTEIYLEEGSILEMETSQIRGVTSSVRTTTAYLKKNSNLLIRENILTSDEDTVKTIFNVELNEEGASCHLISRAVATDNSKQEFISKLVGNCESYAHSECDAILEGNAKVIATPEIVANDKDARLVHEATVGKIAGEQLDKLMSLGLDEKDAENVIISGFLK